MNAVFLTFVLTWAFSAFAQAQVIEVRATGEHKLNGGTSSSAKQLALVDASRKALRETAGHLGGVAEVKALQLKPAQMDAFIAAMVELEEQSTSPAVQDGQSYRVDVVVRLDAVDVARRMGRLRKDQDATRALEELRMQAQELHQQLSNLTTGGAKNEQDQQVILSKLRGKQLASQIYVALAKTEEGPASARVPSTEGRARAKRLADTALATAQDSPDAHYAIGDVFIDAGEIEPAAAAYRKALQADPDSSSGRVKLANVLRFDEKLPEAIAELQEALRINPNSVSAHTDLGYIFSSQKKAAEAISKFQEALRLDPDFIEARNNLAIAFARQGRLPEAVAEFREILRVDPDSALGYYNMAIVLADMDLDTESAEALREVVRINPNHYNAHFNLGELFRLESKFDEAVKRFKEYLRLAPDAPQNQRNIRRAKEFIQTHDNQ